MEAALRRVSCDGEDEELPGSDEPMLPPPYDTIVSLTDRWEQSSFSQIRRS